MLKAINHSQRAPCRMLKKGDSYSLMTYMSEGAEVCKCGGWASLIQMNKVLLAAHMVALTHIWMVWDVMVRVGQGAS